MRELQLTRGKVALIDDEDWARCATRRWYASRADQKREAWYALTSIDGRTVYLHRFIMDAESGVLIDHANRDGLDCRRENLRRASQSQNSQNRINERPPASGYRGVYRDKAAWRVKIQIEGKQINGGQYATPVEAARVYDRRALELFGEFAVLNFPETTA